MTALFTLQDGEALNRAHPDTFYIPDREEREALQPCDCAKLIFDAKDRDGAPCERMWVEVTERLGNGRYVGVLDNDALAAPLDCGTPVRFEARHVIEVFDARDAARARATAPRGPR